MSNHASPLVKALEDAWSELQERHTDLPDAVIVLGTGTVDGQLDHWGTWTPKQWSVTGHKTGEFKLAGEAIKGGAEKVLGVLVHEAAHALNDGRGVNDTSRQGRYHNANFADAAMELGLSVTKDDVYGWSQTSYAPTPQDKPMLKAIEKALKLERPIVRKPKPEEPERRPSIVTECGCPRKLRLKEQTVDEGPILCGVCGEEFIETL